mmetsp:Transcript_18277/g.39544  ORF Transcript_18277/g.39544 Transcript_18277/m.39544 type:complete len:503 (-) Transcript_18277:426-1934(-)
MTSSAGTAAGAAINENAMGARMALFCILPIFVSAFAPRDCPAYGASRASTSRSSTTTVLKYFDDVSRDNSIGWTPSGMELDGIGLGVPTDTTGSIDMERVKAQAAKEKAEAIRRLFGHDAQSASVLSEQQVKDETLSWANDSGIIGDKAECGALLGMNVHNGQTLVSCMAGFWTSVVAFINDIASEQYPTDTWKTDRPKFSRVFMLAFPDCAVLYEYDTMKTMISAIEFCGDSCTHYGRKFDVSHFHPRYDNAPKLISPTLHSPFPSFGLYIQSDAGLEHENNESVNEASRNERSIDSSHLDDFVPQLNETKRSLDALFNSPAALSRVDARSFGHSYQEISANDPIAATKQWIDHQSVDSGNTALKYAYSVSDRWTVSNATIAEEAYADIWNEISKLYDYGFQLEKTTTSRCGGGEDVAENAIVSTMFVTKAYSTYSASEFKRFAITVNAALKQLTGGKIFLEPFHPEYVGKAGAKHENRRSPFPTIQICYHFGARSRSSRG